MSICNSEFVTFIFDKITAQKNPQNAGYCGSVLGVTVNRRATRYLGIATLACRIRILHKPKLFRRWGLLDPGAILHLIGILGIYLEFAYCSFFVVLDLISYQNLSKKGGKN